MAACTAVLGTRELLEGILRHLDFKTLLLAQRVDHRFQTFIMGTEMLQRKLFRNLQGEDVACGELIKIEVDEAREQERVEHLHSISRNDLVVVNSHNQLCILNTNILQVVGTFYQSPDYFEVRLRKGILPCTISANRGKGSCEKMYLARPPLVDHVSFSIRENDEERSKVAIGETRSPAFHGIGHQGSFVKIGRGKPISDGRVLTWHSYTFDANSTLRETMDDIEKRMVDELGYAVNWAMLTLTINGCVLRYRDYLYAERLKIFDNVQETKKILHSLGQLRSDPRISLDEEDRRTFEAVERLWQCIYRPKAQY